MSGSITSLESLSQSQGSDAGESATAIFETQSHAETYSFDEIKRELLDPHAISKKYDQAGRDSTASALHDTRRRRSDTSAEISTGNVRQSELATQLSDVIGSERQLEVAVADRMSAVVVRLKSVLGLSDKRVGALQETLVATQANAESLGQELDQIEATLEALRKEQETLPNTAALVEAYYSKMEVQPLTNEEKRRFLTPEFLSSLSMDEYVVLWRRLNPYYLSHVTRQGFRDHNAMVYHSGGLQEFHNGFVGVMEDESF